MNAGTIIRHEEKFSQLALSVEIERDNITRNFNVFTVQAFNCRGVGTFRTIFIDLRADFSGMIQLTVVSVAEKTSTGLKFPE